MEEPKRNIGGEMGIWTAMGLTSLGLTLLKSTWDHFSVQMYLKRGLTPGGFAVGHFFGGVWNSVNDPLFAFWQDRGGRSYAFHILLGSIPFALASLLPFFRVWELSPLVEFALAFVLFDGGFTYVALAQCGLFADVEDTHKGRTALVAASAVSSFAGALAVGFVFSAIDARPGLSQGVSLVLAAMSLFCFAGTFYLVEVYSGRSRAVVTSVPEDENASDSDSRLYMYMIPYSWFEIVRLSSFQAFVATNFLQIFQSSVLVQLSSVAFPILLPTTSSPSLAILLSLSALIPSALTALLTPLLSRAKSSFQLIRSLLFLQLGASLILGIVLTFNFPPWIIGTCLVLAKSAPGVTFSFFNLPLSSIVDQDARLRKRKEKLASSVFALNALLTKPAESIGPVVMLSILSPLGFGESSNFQSPELQDAVERVVWIVPTLCSTIQLLLWITWYSSSRPQK